MAKKPKRRRVFLETSAVIYHRHGHSLMQDAVQQAIGTGLPEVSNFVRMEYLRGVVLNLIELYFLIEHSDSVRDALIDWSQKVQQDRKLKIVLMTIDSWLIGHEDGQIKHKSKRRLGDLIVRLVREFDEHFPGRIKDRLACRLGRVKFPRQTFSDDMLLRFYERFKSIQTGVPDCLLCSFKNSQQRTIRSRGIDLHGPVQRQTYGANKGFVKQAERIDDAMATQETLPKCRWCERLGDTIIALHAPEKAILVSADRAFEAFRQILNREFQLLPSLATLKQQQEMSAT